MARMSCSVAVLIQVLLLGVLLWSGAPALAARHDPTTLFGSERAWICLPALGCICIGGCSHHNRPSQPSWCVPQPSTPDSALQQMLDFSCSQGADCSAIQPGGSCYDPNNLSAHASYAVNDYWQKMMDKDASCDFNGQATVTTQDPSEYSSFIDLSSTTTPYHLLISLLVFFTCFHMQVTDHVRIRAAARFLSSWINVP